MTLHYGWQSVFFTTGCAGLLWILPWWLFYRDQRSEQAIQRTRLFDSSDILSACRESNLWLLLVARMITDPLWYFFLFWYPKYLEDARYLSLSQLGKIGWIVYLAADIGAVAGGWASGQLIRRSMQTLKARRTVALCAALVIPCTPLIALTQSLYGSIAFASAVALAHMIWLITLGALVVDLFPQRYVATAFGLTATGSGLGGLISTELISHSIAHSGYFTAFCVMGMLHPIALVPIFLLRDRGRRDESSAGIPAVEGL
jgi:ACS family hexuronate transporter-like MFS transporter